MPASAWRRRATNTTDTRKLTIPQKTASEPMVMPMPTHAASTPVVTAPAATSTTAAAADDSLPLQCEVVQSFVQSC